MTTMHPNATPATRSGTWSRRRFLGALAAGARAVAGAGAAEGLLLGCCAGNTKSTSGGGADGAASSTKLFFTARGVVLVPDDLSFAEWPERAAAAGLDRIALHHGLSPALVANFIHSERGQKFVADCRRLGLEIEYELHAMGELLPRELFAADAALFRMNEKGERVPDVNLCVHSQAALALVAENAVKLDQKLTPTTHRRFFWGDDGAPWCRCKECAGFSESDQALIVENHVLAALRRVDASAELAHLAYANTLPPPKQIKPEAGVFLEFAPLAMRFERQLVALGDARNAKELAALDGNLAVFPAATAQALEYWLDDSMYSNWRRPAKEIRWSDEVFAADLATYASRGVRRITTFAVFVDADYVQRFGFPDPVVRYGAGLNGFRR